MATEALELVLKNKNRSKRGASSANFTMQMDIPGSTSLEDGLHTVGRIEGNICITRVSVVVRDGFDGTTPTVALVDEGGNNYLNAVDISAPVVEESALTANNVVRPDPIYKEFGSVFDATIVGADDSTKGELSFIIDYTKLDTRCGKYTH